MSQKSLILIGLSIGSVIGGYLPTLFGADALSMWSILGSGVGAILGIYVIYKYTS
jgi:hypothetical protein